MTLRPRAVLSLVAIGAAVAFAGAALGQDPLSDALREHDRAATADEAEAWQLIRDRRFIKAREAGERIVGRDPSSYVGHLVLGMAHHYGEANFPRALFYNRTALRLLEQQYGEEPTDPDAWLWRTRMLRELALTHNDLEQYDEQLAYIARFNELYPDGMIAEQAWPLMKLGKVAEARRAARRGLREGTVQQTVVALNALCAVEFEAGRDGESYEACRAALDYGRTTAGGPSAVDFTNFAEAARSLFKLDEAEQITLEATEAAASWYANPWLDLAELYTREGRFPEALDALRRVPRYRQERPPHVRDVDRNEGRRALSAFYLAIGRHDDAMRVASRALVAPDRRAHISRDPNQDLAIAALLDRRAKLVAAERLAELSAARPFWSNAGRWFQALALHFEAWMSARQVARWLADDERLVGTFRIGTARGAIMQPWMAGELIDVMGAAVVLEALSRARASDVRTGAGAYYDAFEAEAALSQGDLTRAGDLARRALSALPPAETLLRSRVAVVRAEVARRRQDWTAAASSFEQALLTDPGAIRRMDLRVPVRIEAPSDAVGEAVQDALESSPRLDVVGAGLSVRVRLDGATGSVCIVGASGSVLGCGVAESRADEDATALAERMVDAFHDRAFAPLIDLSQADISSLDGSNQARRDALDRVLGTP